MRSTIKSFIVAMLLAILCVPAFAGTILVVDMRHEANTFFVKDTESIFANGGPGGLIVGYNRPTDFQRIGFMGFDLSSVGAIAFDYAYLSFTEIRTGPFFTGTVQILGNDGTTPVNPSTNWSSSFSVLGDITGTGIGGSHRLFDITTALNAAVDTGQSAIGFALRDVITDDFGFGVLGSNYNSGDPQQYYAQSLYEYPTLILTSGASITPFDHLPARPITQDPLGPPPPPEPPPPPPPPTPGVPLPTAAWMGCVMIALIGFRTVRLRRRRA